MPNIDTYKTIEYNTDRCDKKQWYVKQKHLGCKKARPMKTAVIWLYMWLKVLISDKAKN